LESSLPIDKTPILIAVINSWNTAVEAFLMPRFTYIAISMLALILMAAPSALAQRTGINLSGYSVELEPFRKHEKEQYGLNVVHPYSFSLDTIQKSMRSLFYKQNSLLSSKEGEIFKTAVIKTVAPKIIKQFKRANTNQKIAFEIYSRSGKKFIQGETFLTSQGLNWRFEIIRWEKRDIDSFEMTGEPWVLLPQQNQTYKKWRWKKSKRVSRDITNWLIAENILPATSNILPEPQPTDLAPSMRSDPPPEIRTTKDRLLKLEQLWKEKIITDEEYKTKRKEILSDL